MRKKFLIIGLICVLIAEISNAQKPERIYATEPYGQGVVHERNYVTRTFATTGIICLGIWGCMKFFGGDKK